ncbi:YjbH domain-containing protein [Telluribacter sp. SYSU D00476]|uniref:YjbH domain-containing protein n=1 Tax=Telluribacter sp. SYSU D00476 TaxID=2811430 RepID=UPI001FF6ACB9|nr:YjbH domain-containing protein [Telluribacter sp. SYSU D00476]
MAKKGSITLPFFVLWLMALPGSAQMNIAGKPGLIYTPTARETADGTFTVGAHYNPYRYGFRSQLYSQRGQGNFSERILYANLTLLPRLDVNVTLVHLNGKRENLPRAERMIGDRQLDLKYLLLKEKKGQPSVAVIMSAPFSVQASLITYAVVATKNLDITDEIKTELSVGMGSPYFIFRDLDTNEQNFNIFSRFVLKKKSENLFGKDYLVGPFGGVSLNYRKQAGLMAEWDSKRLNVGGYATLWKRWTLQAGLLNFDQVTFGTSYTVPLNALPQSLRKKES